MGSPSSTQIIEDVDQVKRWKLSTLFMVQRLKDWQIGMDTDGWWLVTGKAGSGEAREVKVRGASFKLTGRCFCTVIC